MRQLAVECIGVDEVLVGDARGELGSPSIAHVITARSRNAEPPGD